MTENEQESYLQWQRSLSLIVAGKTGNALELSELRVTFEVTKGDLETPNHAVIRVYNLAEATSQQIRREFTRVILQAGYVANAGLIFTGNVIQYRSGRENGTDAWLEIWAADGDQAYNFAVARGSVAGGAKPADHFALVADAFAAKGANAGHTPALTVNPLPRGKAYFGPAKGYMRDIARDNDCSWSIQDGQIQLVRRAGYLPGQAVELTYVTGLIGTPEQTNDGITARCLINPKLKINGRIKLDNKSVLRAKTDLFMGDLAVAALNKDGFYRVLRQKFKGDTRGNDWYIDNLCIGIDDTVNAPLDTVQL